MARSAGHRICVLLEDFQTFVNGRQSCCDPERLSRLAAEIDEQLNIRRNTINNADPDPPGRYIPSNTKAGGGFKHFLDALVWAWGFVDCGGFALGAEQYVLAEVAALGTNNKFTGSFGWRRQSPFSFIARHANASARKVLTLFGSTPRIMTELAANSIPSWTPLNWHYPISNETNQLYWGVPYRIARRLRLFAPMIAKERISNVDDALNELTWHLAPRSILVDKLVSEIFANPDNWEEIIDDYAPVRLGDFCSAVYEQALGESVAPAPATRSEQAGAIVLGILLRLGPPPNEPRNLRRWEILAIEFLHELHPNLQKAFHLLIADLQRVDIGGSDISTALAFVRHIFLYD